VSIVSKYGRASGFPSPGVYAWLRSRIRAAGGDPSIVVEPTFRFLRMREVTQLTGLAPSTIYEMARSGELPPPVPLTGVGRSAQTTPHPDDVVGAAA
jgi:predicted DNA-binding transcriptional regulator AlpA